MDNLSSLLKEATNGKEEAVTDLLDAFKQRLLSIDEIPQVIIYLKQAAKTSHHAVYIQGLLYHSGLGVDQSFEMAFITMREAAALGNTKAIYEVGRRLLEGIGVEKNYPSALEWLSLAASSPHYSHQAMYALAHMYEEGLGVEVDHDQAQKWIDKAS